MKNKNEILKTIVAILIGASLVLLTWSYVKEYNKDIEGEEEKNQTEEEAWQNIREEEFLPEEGNFTRAEEITEYDSVMTDLVSCLKKNDVMVYGSKTCPACASLVENFGGYDVVSGIYVECTEEREKCDAAKETKYVPEIQIAGEVYSGGRLPSQLAVAVNCPFEM